MTAPRLIMMVSLAFPLLCAPLPTEAQPAGKVWRVAVVSSTDLASRLRPPLADLGYVDGRNLILDQRSAAEGQAERYRAAIEELLALRPDVIVAPGPHAIRAAQRATATIPIVAISVESDDPVVSGFVRSIARPGGNITGVFVDMPELAGKQLQLLQEALPGLTRVAVLWDPSVSRSSLEAIEAAAHALGITLISLPVQRTEDLERAIGRVDRERVKALLVLPSPMFLVSGARIVELALKHRLPSMFGVDRLVRGGGLMGYGPNFREAYGRVAAYIDRILKGARPAELPVERPTRFDLVINLKTAKALGLTIPPSVLARADQVIE